MPRTNTIDLTVNYYKLLGIKPQKNEAGELAYEYVTETVIREQFRTAARAGHADHAKTEADKAKAKNTDMAKLKNARDCLVEIVGSPSLEKETDGILSTGHQKTLPVNLEEKRLALLQTASIKSLNTLANHESINRVRATHKMRFKNIIDACLAVISFGLAFTSVHFRCRFMNTRSRERLEMARVNFQRALPRAKT